MSRMFPQAGDSVRMVRAGATVTLQSHLAEGGQGVVYRAVMAGGSPVAVKWYRPGPYAAQLRRSIASLASHGRPHRAFAWPLDVVECSGVDGFGYVMPLVDKRFRSLAQMLTTAQQPSFRVIVSIGLELVDAFAALHAAGLCYRDISFGNLLVDPDKAEVAILDNDNVGTDGGDVFVKGTLRFMAPEVIRNEMLPSTVSDLHSLAVFLFYLLIHGHPLEGCRADASYSWEGEGHVSESKLATLHFGLDPLFVFDQQDRSNCPIPGDPMLVWWGIYPQFILDLFTRAFTTGLTDPTLAGRITESVWRRALVRLIDCISVCSCTAAVFWDPHDAERRCWNCGRVPPPPVLLQIPGHAVVLVEGASLSGHHLLRNRDFRGVLASVEAHPSQPATLVLRNRTEEVWRVQPEGEEAKKVAPGQLLRIRPMTIDFGTVRGTIQFPTPPAAGPRPAADHPEL